MDDAAACLLEASEITLAKDVELSGMLMKAAHDSYTDQLHIQSLMKRVRSAYPTTYDNVKTQEGFVYVQLQMALLHNMGIRVIEEPNVGDYFIGAMPMGNMITNPQESKSSNIRMFGNTDEVKSVNSQIDSFINKLNSMKSSNNGMNELKTSWNQINKTIKETTKN